MKTNEIQIRFFHRIYCFYDMKDVEIAQFLYPLYKNYDEFEKALDKKAIEFTWDFS